MPAFSKSGTDRLKGSGRFYITDDTFQSNNVTEDMRKQAREFIRRGAETIKIFTSSGHGGLPWPVPRT